MGTANTSRISTRTWKLRSCGCELTLSRIARAHNYSARDAIVRIALLRKHTAKKKPGPCGPGLSLPALTPTITFQRGTAGCTTIATWEEQRPVAYSAIGV